jgi:hypothetical protein
MDLSSLFFTGRWVVAPLKGLVFPGTCCGCGRKTDKVGEVTGMAKASVGGVLGQLVGYSSTISLTIPLCRDCREAHRRRRRIWAAVGVLVGGAFGAAMAFTMRPGQVVNDPAWHQAIRVATFLVPMILGAAGGWYRGDKQLPVRLKDYSKRDGTVQITFKRPEYGHEFEELLESRLDADTDDGDPANRKKRERKRRQR